MAALAVEEEDELRDMLVNGHRRPRQRRRRVFRPRINLEWPMEGQFRERFRVDSGTATDIEARVGPALQHPSGRNMALTPRQQLLIALRFFATGAFYIIVGDGHGPSTATVGRVIKRVVLSILAAFAGVVRWPSAAEELQNIQQRFSRIGGIPNVVGCVDGTHLRLQVPKNKKDLYMNRKGYTSVNCMAVAGPDRQFFAASVQCSGRVHDARVLTTSGLDEYFRAGGPVQHGMLLGDSAYPLTHWLMTPVADPATPAEMAYNRAHAATRVLVENAFGVLKRRFPGLDTGLRMRRIADSVRAFRAMIVLHNICIAHGDLGNWLDDELQEEPHLQGAEVEAEIPAEAVQRREGRMRRSALIRLFQ